MLVCVCVPYAELLATEPLLDGQTHDGIDLGVWNTLVRRCLRLEQVGLCRERETGEPDGQQQATSYHLSFKAIRVEPLNGLVCTNPFF
jgi:hypothetical protein